MIPRPVMYLLTLAIVGVLIVAIYAMSVHIDSLVITSCVGVVGSVVGCVSGLLIMVAIPQRDRKPRKDKENV